MILVFPDWQANNKMNDNAIGQAYDKRVMSGRGLLVKNRRNEYSYNMETRFAVIWSRFLAACVAALMLLAGAALAHAVENTQRKPGAPWHAGNFSFSDELGGFSIIDVRGRGTYDDPVIVTQDILTVANSVLTIRPLSIKKGTYSFNSNWTTLHLRLRTINRSPASWIGFRIELQGELGKPSIYGDGLSFNQLTRDESDILSDRFARYEVEHEPGDSLVFNDGWVDQYDAVLFSVFLLDLTPGPVFYIEQTPFLPAS